MTAEYAGQAPRPPAKRWDYPARAAVWFGFDIDDYASGLFAHVVGREMRRRLPNARIRLVAPGRSHVTRFDGSAVVHAHELVASESGCVVCGGPPRFDVVPVDEVGRATAIAGPASEFAALAPQAFATGVLQKRLDFLRHMGWYPREGGAVVVQPDRASVDAAEALATVATRSAVVLAPLADGGRRVADELSSRLSFEHWLLPCDVTLTDLVAAIAAASLFAGSDVHANVTAASFGRRQVLLAEKTHASFGLRPGRLGDVVSALMSTTGPDQGVASLTARAEQMFDVLAEDVVAACARAAGVAAPSPQDRAESEGRVKALIASEAHATARIGDRLAAVQALASRVQGPFVPMRRRVLKLLGRALPTGIRESATVQAVYTRLIRRR
jgi:hypothetical protein